MNNVPAPMQQWYSELPSQNCGKFYATIKTPFLPIYIEHLVPVWGQVCDGRARKSTVHTALLYNKFPNHGKGFTYISWRTVPDNPQANKYPRTGKIDNPQPYSGIPHSEV